MLAERADRSRMRRAAGLPRAARRGARPGLRPILLEPGEVLCGGAARTMQARRVTEAWAKFILAQQRALKLILTKRADARSRGETPPGFNECGTLRVLVAPTRARLGDHRRDRRTYQNDLSELSERNLKSLILPHFQRQQRQADALQQQRRADDGAERPAGR